MSGGELERVRATTEKLRERLEAEGCSPEEVEYGLAFYEVLAVGDVEPSPEGLDPDRVRQIERWLRRGWWSNVSRMQRGRR